MTDAVHIFVPLFAFMLIPVWIPLIAAAAGGVRDLFRTREAFDAA